MIGKAVFFPVFLNTLQGIRGVSKEFVEVARIFEYNRLLLLRRVVLPAALPSIFVGLRYGAGAAWAVGIKKGQDLCYPLLSFGLPRTATVFKPWLDKTAADEQIISLMADLMTDDFDNPTDDNKSAIRQCLAANVGRNAVVSAFCDGPAPSNPRGTYFIGISTGTHKWE